MLSENQATKLAAMANLLRADWSPAQVMAVLADERIRLRRHYTDVAVALAVIATDPTTRQPTRIYEQGPWWQAAHAANGGTPAATIREPGPDDCAECGKPEAVHYLATYADHEYLRPMDHDREVAERTRALQEGTA